MAISGTAGPVAGAHPGAPSTTSPVELPSGTTSDSFGPNATKKQQTQIDVVPGGDDTLGPVTVVGVNRVTRIAMSGTEAGHDSTGTSREETTTLTYSGTSGDSDWDVTSSNSVGSTAHALARHGSTTILGNTSGNILSLSGTTLTLVQDLTKKVTELVTDGTTWMAGLDDGRIAYATDPTSSTGWTEVVVASTSTDIDNVDTNGTYWIACYSSVLYTATTPSGPWTKNNSSGVSGTVTALANDGTNFFLAVNGGYFTTTDPTGAWTLVDTGSFRDAMLVDGGTLWIGGSDKVFWTDTPTVSGGLECSSHSSLNTVRGLALNGGYLVATNSNGYILTTDSPKSTSAAWVYQGSYVTTGQVIPDGDNFLAAGSGVARFISTPPSPSYTTLTFPTEFYPTGSLKISHGKFDTATEMAADVRTAVNNEKNSGNLSDYYVVADTDASVEINADYGGIRGDITATMTNAGTPTADAAVAVTRVQGTGGVAEDELTDVTYSGTGPGGDPLYALIDSGSDSGSKNYNAVAIHGTVAVLGRQSYGVSVESDVTDTTNPVDTFPMSFSVYNDYPATVVTDGTTWVVANSKSGFTAYSTDPVNTWADGQTLTGGINEIFYESSTTTWIAVGDGGQIWSATDPTSATGWTLHTTLSGTPTLTAVTSDGTTWLIGDSNGVLYTSTSPSGAWTTVGDIGGRIYSLYTDGTTWLAGRTYAISGTTTPGTFASWVSATRSSGSFFDDDVEYIWKHGGYWFCFDRTNISRSPDGLTGWHEVYQDGGSQQGYASHGEYALAVGAQGGFDWFKSYPNAAVSTYTFDAAYSTDPVVITHSTSPAPTAITMAAEARTGLNAAITATTLTGYTVSSGTDAKVELDASSTGVRKDIVASVSGATASLVTSVENHGVNPGDPSSTKTSWQLIAAGHSPSTTSGTFGNVSTLAGALDQVRNVFINSQIGGFSNMPTEVGANTYFDVTDTDAEAMASDLVFTLPDAGTGGDLTVSATVITAGVDPSITGPVITIEGGGIASPVVIDDTTSYSESTLPAVLDAAINADPGVFTYDGTSDVEFASNTEALYPEATVTVTSSTGDITIVPTTLYQGHS